MAGGIDWFRWHHGSVTDPKFQLVARKSGVRLPDVLAVWAFVLEKASASESRGTFGELDSEAIDCLFGLDDGKTSQILEQMGVRGLVEGGQVVAWERRQPKREREDDTAADRKRKQRERDASESQSQPEAATQGHVTPCHTTSHQKTPRGEERREEESNTSSLRSDETAPASRKPSVMVKAAELEAEGVLPEHARDWLKARKVALTQTAWAGIKREAAKAALSSAEVVRIMAEKGWRSFDADWIARARGSPGIPINKQEALEARNRAVAEQWLMEQGDQYASSGQVEILDIDH